MRRPSASHPLTLSSSTRTSRLALGFTILALALPLAAQEVTVGPLISLPEIDEINSIPTMVSLQDGTSVVTVKVRNVQETLDFQAVTLDPQQGAVTAHWSGSVGSIPNDTRLAAVDDQVFLMDNPWDLSMGVEPRLLARLQNPQQGNDSGLSFQINPAGSRPTDDFNAVQLVSGDLVAVWADSDPNGDGSLQGGTYLQRFSPQGDLLGDPELVTPNLGTEIRVVAAPSGGFQVVWQANPTGFQVFGRQFDALGQAIGPVQDLIGPGEQSSEFDVTAFADGTYLVVWAQFNFTDPNELFGRRLDANGSPLPETLPIAPMDAFGVSSPYVRADAFGRAWVVWAASGTIFLRAVDAAGNLGSMVAVPPSTPGRTQFAPQLTIDANGNGLVVWQENVFARQMYARTFEINPSCTDGDTMLCLHHGRFQVEVEWTDYDGESGQGRVVPFQSSDSGLFWFFDAANWEVMVKVIDGCDFNGFYWFFSAATTDVAYDLKVTDTVSGLQQIYSNGLGEPAPANTDTMALMSCGHGPP